MCRLSLVRSNKYYGLFSHCEMPSPKVIGPRSAPFLGGALSPQGEAGGLWKGVQKLNIKRLSWKEGESGRIQKEEPIMEGFMIEAEEVATGEGEKIKGEGRQEEGEKKTWVLEEWAEEEDRDARGGGDKGSIKGGPNKSPRPWHKPYWGRRRTPGGTT